VGYCYPLSPLKSPMRAGDQVFRKKLDIFEFAMYFLILNKMTTLARKTMNTIASKRQDLDDYVVGQWLRGEYKQTTQSEQGGSPVARSCRSGALENSSDFMTVIMGHCYYLLPVGWTPADVPSQAGKVALVTGANSGIGFEVTRKLAENGAKVRGKNFLAVLLLRCCYSAK